VQYATSITNAINNKISPIVRVRLDAKTLTSVFVVQLRAGREFRSVLRDQALFFVPPGAAAVEVISDVRRTDNSHRQSIAQIF
jgi:hypothetical protein